MEQTKERTIDWNHIFLLGWYGPVIVYLTTWEDTEETRNNYIRVIVTGPDVQQWGPPIWKAPANCRPNDYGCPSHPYMEYELHEIKEEEDAKQKARELGGVLAIGWYIKKGFERSWD